MFAACCQCSVLFFYRIYIRRKVLIRETHNSLGAMCLPDREEEIREDFLRERVCKHSGIGEAIIIRIAADYVIENANPENIPSLNESGRAVTIFPARSGVSGRMAMRTDDGCGAIGRNCRFENFPRHHN